MRRLTTMWGAFRSIGRAVPAPPGSGPRARPAGAGVYSGWIGPDGRVEEALATAVHVALLARVGEPTKDGFFAKGAVRYLDATDDISLELMGQHPVALANAIEALTTRWSTWTWNSSCLLGSCAPPAERSGRRWTGASGRLRARRSISIPRKVFLISFSSA